MKILNQDIKEKTFKPIYLLMGDETFLKRSYKQRFKSAIADDDMNYSYFEGKDINVSDFLKMADTMPFFAERRCIIVENSKWFKTANEEVVSYIDRLPETTVLIFIEEEVDKRNKLYKKVVEKGYIAELVTPSYQDLKKWAAGLIIREKKNIRSQDMDLILSYVGEDMEILKNEIDKLLSYVGEREVIEKEDIDAVITVNLENKVFDMIRYLTQKKRKEAMRLYGDLIGLREAPTRILSLLIRQFKQFLDIKLLSMEHSDKDEIAKALGLSSYIVGKLLPNVRGFDKSTLIYYVRKGVELEEDIKTGKINDRIALELFIGL